MKKLILFILSIPLLSFSQTIEQRAESVDIFFKSLPEIESSVELKAQKIRDYQSDQMINKDKEYIQTILGNFSKEQEIIQKSSSSSFTGNARKYAKQIAEKQGEVEQYKSHAEKIKKIESDTTNSKRLNKFIAQIQSGSFLSDATKRFVPSYERQIAEQYEKSYNYVARNRGIQASLERNISDLNKDAEKSLSFPENARSDVELALERISILESKMADLQAEHKNTQLDIYIKSQYDSGLFACEKTNQPRFYQLKNHPELIAFGNTNAISGLGIKSVYQFNKDSPHAMNFIYKCKKPSSFGGCLDNTEKQLCSILSTCESKLRRAEEAFSSELFLPIIKKDYFSSEFHKDQQRYVNGKAIDVIAEWESEGRVGQIGREKLYEEYFEVIEKISEMDENNVNLYKKQASNYILKQKKKRLSKYSKSSNTYKSLNYLYNSLESFVDRLFKQDNLEEYTYSTCSDKRVETSDFCRKFKSYKDEISSEMQFEELENLTQDSCPRVVLRAYTSVHNKITSSTTSPQYQSNSEEIKNGVLNE